MTLINSTTDVVEVAFDALDRVRSVGPKVHCLTNAAAGNFTANLLLAVGAVPSLTDHPDEVPDFVRAADALTVNLGTPDTQRMEAVRLAIAARQDVQGPWVLDPVMIDRSAARCVWAKTCLAEKPTLVRLNAGEADALGCPDGEAEGALITAHSGPVDRIMSCGTVVEIRNGNPMMARITATGCALGAFAAACVAVAPYRFDGAVGAHLCFAVAGEIAADRAQGPGSYAPAFLDALYGLTQDELAKRSKVHVLGT